MVPRFRMSDRSDGRLPLQAYSEVSILCLSVLRYQVGCSGWIQACVYLYVGQHDCIIYMMYQTFAANQPSPCSLPTLATVRSVVGRGWLFEADRRACVKSMNLRGGMRTLGNMLSLHLRRKRGSGIPGCQNHGRVLSSQQSAPVKLAPAFGSGKQVASAWH